MRWTSPGGLSRQRIQVIFCVRLPASMGKTTSPCSFPAWGGSPGAEQWWPLEPSPGPLSGWAVLDAETPRQCCIHEPLWGIHSVESCGVQNISLGQQHQDNHGGASQWLVAPRGDWFMSCSIWQCDLISPKKAAAFQTHPKTLCGTKLLGKQSLELIGC